MHGWIFETSIWLLAGSTRFYQKDVSQSVKTERRLTFSKRCSEKAGNSKSSEKLNEQKARIRTSNAVRKPHFEGSTKWKVLEVTGSLTDNTLEGFNFQCALDAYIHLAKLTSTNSKTSAGWRTTLASVWSRTHAVSLPSAGLDRWLPRKPTEFQRKSANNCENSEINLISVFSRLIGVTGFGFDSFGIKTWNLAISAGCQKSTKTDPNGDLERAPIHGQKPWSVRPKIHPKNKWN